MITIIGCGTLGSRVAHKLRDCQLSVVDHDVVYEHNLASQKYSRRDIGTQKVYALMRVIPSIRAHNTFLDETNIQLLGSSEAIIDCTDNLLTRKLLGQYCYENGIPLIHGAAAKKRGIVGCFINNPCLACVYKNKISLENCRGSEINEQVAEQIANKQASLARKVLSGKEHFELYLVYPQKLEEIHLQPCQGCKEQHKQEQFYMTWCPLAAALSAKPLQQVMLKEETIKKKDVRIEVHPNGEIHFFGSEDIDELKRLAKEIYNNNSESLS